MRKFLEMLRARDVAGRRVVSLLLRRDEQATDTEEYVSLLFSILDTITPHHLRILFISYPYPSFTFLTSLVNLSFPSVVELHVSGSTHHNDSSPPPAGLDVHSRPSLDFGADLTRVFPRLVCLWLEASSRDSHRDALLRFLRAYAPPPDPDPDPNPDSRLHSRLLPGPPPFLRSVVVYVAPYAPGVGAADALSEEQDKVFWLELRMMELEVRLARIEGDIEALQTEHQLARASCPDNSQDKTIIHMRSVTNPKQINTDMIGQLNASDDAKSASVACQWYYKDPEGNVRGPYSSDLMDTWFREGRLALDLSIRRESETKFTRLESLCYETGSIHPFYPGRKHAHAGVPVLFGGEAAIGRAGVESEKPELSLPPPPGLSDFRVPGSSSRPLHAPDPPQSQVSSDPPVDWLGEVFPVPMLDGHLPQDIQQLVAVLSRCQNVETLHQAYILPTIHSSGIVSKKVRHISSSSSPSLPAQRSTFNTTSISASAMTATRVGYAMTGRSLVQWAYDTKQLPKEYQERYSERQLVDGARNLARRAVENSIDGVALELIEEAGIAAEWTFMVVVNRYNCDRSHAEEEDHHVIVKEDLEGLGFKSRDMKFKAALKN
ncbi:hypothetical protein EIP91_001696 [Steccherinum ochraceum]|uniref:GYF domain-containing protein n=1 Tax=Steccherinum ochraceum TaxID=92696 RepID=A0A4R0RFV3_9APHY|nr:hypothetical protein EIP91_001696 [Steccherinum ochraceum]